MEVIQENLITSEFSRKIFGKIVNNGNKELSFQLVSSLVFHGKPENFDVKIINSLNSLQVRFMTTRFEFPSLLMKQPWILNHLNSRLDLGNLKYRFQRRLIFYSYALDTSFFDTSHFLNLFERLFLVFQSEIQKVFDCDRNLNFEYKTKSFFRIAKEFRSDRKNLENNSGNIEILEENSIFNRENPIFNRENLIVTSFQSISCPDCSLSTSDCECINRLKEGDFILQNFPEILSELDSLSCIRDYFDLDSGFFDPETCEYSYNPANLLSNELKKYPISESFNKKLFKMFRIMEKNSIFFKRFPAELLVVFIKSSKITDFRLALVFEQVSQFKRLFTLKFPGNYLNEMRIAYEILILHSINMKDVLEEDFIDRSCFKFPDLDKQMKIGSGGFGRVFKNELKSEQVAIKIQEEKKKSFSVILNEFGILKRLHHQFVVETYGLVRYKQKDCIVMPFVDGGSLKDLTQNKLTLFEALNMMKNLSKGLAYIHRLQVIHQDIKPHNILLKYPKTEGSSRQPVIIDFGLAANLLNRKSLRGFTWQYSDPDQIENKSPGFEADIWSFGMTFYWVLFQKNPFSLSGDKRKDLSYPRNQARLVHKMIKKEGLRPVIDYRFQEDFPLITQILKDCWKVNPKDRPSAIEVCKRLDDIIRNFKGLERLI